MNDLEQARRAKTGEVQRLLREAYGTPAWRPHMDPISELVSTILSQNTNDVNRDVAFGRLRECLPTWEEVRDADLQIVVNAIRPAGLANQKGPRIQEALRIITRERGELSLDFLAGWPVDQAKDWLVSIKGVGPKTAAIVLLFSDKPLANDSISSPSFISSDSNSPARSSLVAISLSSSSTFFLNAKISSRVGPYFLFRRLISSNLASISSSLSGFTSTFWP